jgi:hypothetical protein
MPNTKIRASNSIQMWLADTAGWNNKQVQPNSRTNAAENLELAKGFEPPTA